MFDKLKGMSTLAGLMQNKAKLKEAGERIKRELAALHVTGESGSGAVRVTASGEMAILDVSLSPALAAGLAASDSSRDYAQTLIRDATNAALTQARHKMQEIVRREAEAQGLGDLLKDMGGLENLLR